jgi:hypothetical protein|tara:strand:+ start:728 stop:994 length:267 start_codon:yes stop_codon:yes gene_type:complete
MKYIVGASIGGLFGIGAPFMMNVKDINENNEFPRQEEFQLMEEGLSAPIEGALILPDNMCGYINYDSKDLKEQAKECLSYSIPAIPAI